MIRIAEANMRKRGDTLASELNALIQSASELLESLDDQRGDAVEGLRSRAARNIDSARRRLRTVKPRVVETGSRAAQATIGFARRNPWSTAAVGALVVASVAAVLYMRLSED